MIKRKEIFIETRRFERVTIRSNSDVQAELHLCPACGEWVDSDTDPDTCVIPKARQENKPAQIGDQKGIVQEILEKLCRTI